ncbi:hypothetical protein N657DRAFT_576349 [Parathielavia appendiculata]|uniref:DUF6536 domain-containing protein n=1 Tax=Parathielavia appendiculata TaxID=2587402 RepID=A0AAN6TX65_9PEZI|nr:hypothetical protein N657DRAFT_576349 [Parathielavia appendiculata]
MEMLIPPRDHGPSTYRYTWDENGEIAQVTRVRDSRPFSIARRSPGWQSAQWPFQSIITTTTITTATTDNDPASPASPSCHHHQHRRASSSSAFHSTWQPDSPHPHPQTTTNKTISNGSSEETPTSRVSLVPDYVATFLRFLRSSINSNTTPESTLTIQQQHPETPIMIPHRDRYYTSRNSDEAEKQERTITPQKKHCVVQIVVPSEHPHPQHQQHRSGVADFYDERGVRIYPDDSVHVLEAGIEGVDSRDCDREAGGEHPVVGEEEQGFLGSSVVWDRVSGGFTGEKGNGGDKNWKRRGGTRWLSGWRAGVAMNVLAVFVVLMAGFVCLVVAISRVSLDGERSAFFVGPCAAARGPEGGLHAVISVFVVVLVAGANYTFQVIASPTREEVTAAHLGREWLDIGIPSFRGIRRIERGRGFLAVMVLVMAVLTQIMYNAVIYVSQTAPNYKAALVSEPFVAGASFNSDSSNNVGGLSRVDLETLQQRAARGETVRLSASACINQFSAEFETEYSAVLLISASSSASLIQTSLGTIQDLVPTASAIQYCLAFPAAAPTCEVSLNAPLLGSVALVNAITLLATATVLFRRPSSFRPLATLGDAISSFLQDPDPTTQGACLLSKSDVRHGRWPLQESKFWVPRTHRWLRSVSGARWLATFSLWVACISLCAGGLAFSLTPSHPETTTPQHLPPFGSTPSPHALILLPASSIPPSAAAVLASLPQLLLANLYLAVNALLTTYYLSQESALFATGPAPRSLRVSADDAEGEQTTSVYLTLPVPVSALLMACFMGLAFILSQSFFAVSVRLEEVHISSLSGDEALSLSSGSRVPSPAGERTIVALGFSGLGLLVLLVVFVLLAVAVVGLGLRRAPPVGVVNGDMFGNPMALPGGSCSAVLSARCHPLAREKGLWREPVMWGVVREGVGFGVSHCGFTAGRAGVVVPGRNYA